MYLINNVHAAASGIQLPIPLKPAASSNLFFYRLEEVAGFRQVVDETNPDPSRCHFINFRFANSYEDSKMMNPPSYQNRPLYNPRQKLFKLKRTENNKKEDGVIDNVFRLRKRSSTASDNFGNVFRLKKRFLNYDSQKCN